jgi:hypothetical protein
MDSSSRRNDKHCNSNAICRMLLYITVGRARPNDQTWVNRSGSVRAHHCLVIVHEDQKFNRCGHIVKVNAGNPYHNAIYKQPGFFQKEAGFEITTQIPVLLMVALEVN